MHSVKNLSSIQQALTAEYDRYVDVPTGVKIMRVLKNALIALVLLAVVIGILTGLKFSLADITISEHSEQDERIAQSRNPGAYTGLETSINDSKFEKWFIFDFKNADKYPEKILSFFGIREKISEPAQALSSETSLANNTGE